MVRAALLIGVKRTGGLPELQAVDASIADMKQWCANQGIQRPYLEVLTDAQGDVTSAAVYAAIDRLLVKGDVSQLFVYFTGHGLNINSQEFWLLSGAPQNTNEAINVEASIVLARRNKVPHVVFISDACRSAPTTIQSQGIQGSGIFPNLPPQGTEKAIDIFFGCTLGDPSLEIKITAEAGAEFRALFTDSLVSALSGKVPAILESDAAEADKYVVRSWPLKAHLQKDVTRRIREAGLTLQARQTPDARITSNPTSWVSILDKAAVPSPPEVPAAAPPSPIASPGPEIRRPAPESRPRPSPIPRAPSGSGGATRGPNLQTQLRREITHLTEHDDRLLELTDRAFALCKTEITPRISVRGSAFRVKGGAFADVVVDSGTAVVASRDLILLPQVAEPVTALVILDSGDGVLLPAIDGYAASLIFDKRELICVSYDHMLGTIPPAAMQAQQGLKTLRALGTAAAVAGVLRMDREIGEVLLKSVLSADYVDPALVLYTTYACHDLGMTSMINEIERRSLQGLGFELFDTAMLSNRFFEDNKKLKVFPFVPMLSQGWSLLDVYGVSLPGGLERLNSHRQRSMWTLFDSDGVALLRHVLIST